MEIAAKRIVSAVLLGCGLLLVFLGLSSALGFTVAGMLASAGVIVALLYAGAIWFTPSSRRRSARAAAEEEEKDSVGGAYARRR